MRHYKDGFPLNFIISELKDFRTSHDLDLAQNASLKDHFKREKTGICSCFRTLNEGSPSLIFPKLSTLIELYFY